MTNNLDNIFSALGDPTRRAVIENLMAGPMPVGALHAHHDIALPTFLRHLKVLETSGLVKSHKKGRVRTVHLEAAPMQAAQTWITAQQRIWDRRLDQLQILAETPKEP
ncbi:MAG: ArsR/SmtB family transcription factor [Planktomarina sp.]